MYLQKYLEAKHTYNKLKKTYFTHIQSKNIIGGAGVVIISQLNDRPVVLIVRNKFTNKWDIPGGKVDLNEDPDWAAARELREETKGLFKFSPDILTDFTFSDKIYPESQNAYRSYFVYVSLPTLAFYYENQIKLDIRAKRIDIPESYFETNDIDFMYLDQFYRDMMTSRSTDVYTQKSDGTPIIMRGRDTVVLRDNQSIIKKLLKTTPLELNFTSRDDQTKISYLKGLNCYWL